VKGSVKDVGDRFQLTDTDPLLSLAPLLSPGASAARGEPGRIAGGGFRGGIISEPTVDRDPFAVAAASFLARFRAGERPGVGEYSTRYPEPADRIRRLLPSRVMGEQRAGVPSTLSAPS
jgi:hypothetical protein